MKDFDRSCGFKNCPDSSSHGLRLIIYTDWFIRFNCRLSFKFTSSEVLIDVEMNTSLEGNHGLVSEGVTSNLFSLFLKKNSFLVCLFFKAQL